MIFACAVLALMGIFVTTATPQSNSPQDGFITFDEMRKWYSSGIAAQHGHMEPIVMAAAAASSMPDAPRHTFWRAALRAGPWSALGLQHVSADDILDALAAMAEHDGSVAVERYDVGMQVRGGVGDNK